MCQSVHYKMKNHTINPETLRKRNSKQRETTEQREARLARDRERKRKNRAMESVTEREKRLQSIRDKRRQKKEMETPIERGKRKERENERRQTARKRARHETIRNEMEKENVNEQAREQTRQGRNRQEQTRRERNRQEEVLVDEERNSDINTIPQSATTISEEEIQMLNDFRKEMDDLHYELCNVCNERIPSMPMMVEGVCKRCYKDKNEIKKFSSENNMDPGDIPDELKSLSEIEEMLIAQVCTVISVYRLRGGQLGYRGNVINFNQDIHEFITRLPRNPSSLDVLVVRRQSSNDPSAFRDFTVRRSKVCRALLWLKENNTYYNDITIDNEILESLPENGSVFNMLPQIHEKQTVDDDANDNEHENEYENESISRTFVPLPPPTRREDDAINETLDRMQSNNSPTIWPDIEGVPINEFKTAGYIARAFPTLYPYGRADFRSSRAIRVLPAEYFKHLLWYKDGRFARHSRWRYFALNSSMRWRALQEGQVYVIQNLRDEQINVKDIQEMIENGDDKMADRIMRYGEGLRGTRQFWMARRYELTDMIKQIGHRGLIFFTFSAADLHWPELHKLMELEGHNGDEAESARKRQQNLIDNPHIAAWFFKKRFEIFFDNILVKQWELDEWWYRYEWQHRGSVHIHGIGKKRNAPTIDWNTIKDNEEEKTNVMRYLDSVVTTINPNINAPFPERHPCQKGSDEINYNLQDYVELINKLQRHTRCSPSYCIRVKGGQQVCRFGYPKDINDHTIICEDKQGQPELVTSRNDPYINPHNRMQLQGWRANVDIKPVLSIHAALQYISKYASKAEPKSVAFTEIFNQILNQSNQDENSLTSIQKLLLNSVAERDISAQETCHLLLGMPLYHSSRQCVSLNLNEETIRWIQGTGYSGNDEEPTTTNGKGRTSQSALKKYWERVDKFEEFSLYRLNLTHKFEKGSWQKVGKENIVRIWPRPSGLRNGEQWEEFCRIKVLLHVPHRSIEQLNGNSDVPWSTIYSQNIDVINSDPNDLLGQPIDKEPELCDEDSFDEIEEEQEEEFRYDWMHLAELGPNTHIQIDADLGSRDMDRNHNWTNEAQQRYSSEDLANVNDFVKQAASDNNNGNIRNDKDSTEINYDSLNQKQKTIFKRIEKHYEDTILGQQVEPLRIIVMGTAGTGKSYVIKAIRARLRAMAEKDGKSPVLVIAPTGVAAFNINGSTIHSTLSIPIMNDKKYELNSIRLKQLQERLQNVSYFIIDEKSMVGRRMLGIIDMRLRQAFPENKNEPFGGRSIILFGDFGQLPPVLDLPMYTNNASRDESSNNGLVAYKQFKEVYELEQVHRQSGTEQQEFKDILLRLREGETNINDWKILAKRFDENLNRIERDRFQDAVFILTKWVEVDKVNNEMLRSLNRPIAKINAVHTGGSEAKRANSDVAKGLEAQLLLTKGCRVMLTSNLWTEAGLVNGSMGIVQDILFEDQGPPALPTAVFVNFEKYNGPTIKDHDGNEVVPIVAIKRSWEGKSGTCSRLQIPLCLAWAITVHKSQGLTLKKSKIDIGDKEFAAGLTFVALSRARSLNDILLKPFNFDRLQRIKNCKRLQERMEEEERLRSLIQ
jgi:ATP-dependent DNA helicase PIF1